MKFNTKSTEEKMQKSVASYEGNLSTIRASQANAAVVSKVTFEYYGAPTRIVNDITSLFFCEFSMGNRL